MNRRGFLGAVAAGVAAALVRRDEPTPRVEPLMSVHDTIIVRAPRDITADELRRSFKVISTETGRFSSRKYQ